MKSTAVIIGGGLGGLFTGAILSKEGVHVTVIEKNATPGGGLQSFVRHGETYDTGMHVIAGMHEGGNIRRICDYLGITDKIHIKDVDSDLIDSLYFAQDKKTYRIASGKENFINSLAEEFPHQRKNLEKYVKALYDIVSEIDLFNLRSSDTFMPIHGEDFMLSVQDFIAKYISDEKLRSVLAYMNPLYGGRDNMTPAYLHSLIAVLYINGPSRFAGGSVLFANTLVELIRENGGEVILADGVSKVFSREKRITGVLTRKGRRFEADWYICAIHPCSFFQLLDDPSVLPKAYRTRLDNLNNAYSAFTLNIKLKPGTVRYVNHSMYYMSRYDRVWDFDRADVKWPLGFLCMTPPEIEQGEFSTKMIITAPMVWEHVKKWENTTVGHRGEEYEKWKQECAETLLDMIEELYPDIRDCILEINTASPLTIRDYYGVKEGSMCGFSKDWKNITASQVPVVTKAKNLLMTGQNCNGHGFCGVPLTAINTCEVILGRNYVLDKINNK